MKKLVIIRGGKSKLQGDLIDDYDRPLTEEGLKEAHDVGKLLLNKGLLPDCIMSSPAFRAIETAKIISNEVNYEKTITPNQYIYEAYVNTLQELVSFIHDDNDVVFLVGHNPGVSALAYMLCELKESIAPCATVEIDFDCNSWMDVSKNNSKLISYDFPKITT